MNLTSKSARIGDADSVSGTEELHKYSQSLLYVLGKIKINNLSPDFKAHLKNVYELLDHLQPDEKFLARHKELLKKQKGDS
jgi:hypothetical protein